MNEIDAQSHIINNNQNTQNDLAVVAKKLYDEKEYEKALKIYTDMLIYSADSDLYVKMGNCFDKLNKSSTAIEYWQKAIDIDALNSDAFINIGNYYYKKNEYEKAISYWIASLVSMPEEPTSNLNLAITYTFKEMPMEAFKYYTRYLKYAQDKSTTKYKEIYEKIEKNKKLANDYLKLGVQYQGANDNISALKCYIRSTQYCPMLSKSYLNIGSLYYADKNYEDAIKYWTKAEYLDPNYPKILCNLAISYDILEKYDYAYCYYSRYTNYINNNKIEYEKITSRCLKLKPILNKNPYLITNHLEAAKEAFSKCDYYEAIKEFKHYTILRPEEIVIYGEMITKIENYLSPEIDVILSCQETGKRLLAEKKYQEAQKYFARILILADNSSIEFTNAKRKFTICLQNS